MDKSDNLKTKRPFSGPPSTNFDDDMERILANDHMDIGNINDDKEQKSENNVDGSERILANDCMDIENNNDDSEQKTENNADDLERMDLSQKRNKFSCALCGLTFSRNGNLRRHEKKIHSVDNTACTQVCGICNLKCRTIVDLHNHIESEHPDIKLIFHNEVFCCQSDFDDWKHEIERQTVSSFVLKIRKVNENTEVVYYKCSRSGLPEAKGKTSKIKRHTKYAGTIKTGITCPAMIKATKETCDEATEITVHYQSMHLGHKCEVGKLNLQREDRTMLADMLRSGIPINAVIDKTQAQFSPTKRLGLTTRQDIYNIARDFNVSNVVHKDDAMAVDITVKK